MLKFLQGEGLVGPKGHGHKAIVIQVVGMVMVVFVGVIVVVMMLMVVMMPMVVALMVAMVVVVVVIMAMGCFFGIGLSHGLVGSLVSGLHIND